jgi:hypothetical protein
LLRGFVTPCAIDQEHSVRVTFLSLEQALTWLPAGGMPVSQTIEGQVVSGLDTTNLWVAKASPKTSLISYQTVLPSRLYAKLVCAAPEKSPSGWIVILSDFPPVVSSCTNGSEYDPPLALSRWASETFPPTDQRLTLKAQLLRTTALPIAEEKVARKPAAITAEFKIELPILSI